MARPEVEHSMMEGKDQQRATSLRDRLYKHVAHHMTNCTTQVMRASPELMQQTCLDIFVLIELKPRQANVGTWIRNSFLLFTIIFYFATFFQEVLVKQWPIIILDLGRATFELKASAGKSTFV